MLVCPTADEAAEAAWKIVEATAESDLPAARAGLAIGPLLARGGDYFGLPVNMASRLVDRADPGTVLVDQSFMTLHRRFALEPLARIPLKGIGGALLGGCDAKREPSEIRSARRPRQDGSEPSSTARKPRSRGTAGVGHVAGERRRGRGRSADTVSIVANRDDRR